MNILQMRNTNAFPNRNGYTLRYVILHGTAGGSSAQAIASYFQSTQVGSNPVSAHYVIGVDGAIVQCNDEKDGAWANGLLTRGHDAFWDESINPNLLTISIEHVKPDSANATPLTPAQQAASFMLIKDICQRWHIPMRAADASGGITGHYSIDPINRSRCPGTYPWDGLWAFLKGGSSMVPAGWKDDGHTLTAPNGVAVVLGFRDWVLNHVWNPQDWPLQVEEARAQLETSNPSVGGGSWQPFRWTVLEYTPDRGVFEAWAGAELLVTRKLLQALTAPPADLVALLTTLLAASEQLSSQIQAALSQIQPGK